MPPGRPRSPHSGLLAKRVTHIPHKPGHGCRAKRFEPAGSGALGAVDGEKTPGKAWKSSKTSENIENYLKY